MLCLFDLSPVFLPFLPFFAPCCPYSVRVKTHNPIRQLQAGTKRQGHQLGRSGTPWVGLEGSVLWLMSNRIQGDIKQKPNRSQPEVKQQPNQWNKVSGIVLINLQSSDISLILV